MFLWVSSGPLLSLLFFFLLCFRSSFDISRVPCICSTCFCPKVLPFPFSPLLLCFCMYSFVIFVLLHLRVFLFLISRLKLPVLCLDTSWPRGYTCSVPASFCGWSAKPVLSSFASGVSWPHPLSDNISHLHSEINWGDYKDK